MTIIVTGGAGFIGSNFIFHMLNTYPDYRIVCLDCLTYAGNLSTLAPVMDNPNFRFVKESITDREAVYKLFEEEHPDIVVNFAAESHVDRSIENPEVFLNTNILGTAVLMDACRKYGIQRYHQVSTDEVYGDLPLDRPDLFFTEETPIHTSSPYSSSKAGADLLVLAYHRTYGLPVTISRCSNNYGPYHFPEKLIPLMIANALNDKPLPVYGTGENVRDWLYVEDHCRAIGDGDEFSFRECFCEALPFADESFDLVLANHVLFYCSDVTQACREAARVLKPGGRFLCSTYGADHMKEISRLVSDFDSRIVLSADCLYERFGRENGAEILAPYFSDVKWLSYEDSLLVPDAEPLILYILSCHGNQNQYLLDHFAEFRSFVKKKTDAGFSVTKDAGVFCCTK